MNTIVSKNNYINELMLAFYLYMFVLLRIPIVLNLYSKENNILVLGSLAALMLAFSFIIKKNFFNKNLLMGVSFIAFIVFLLLIDALTRYNNIIFDRLYEFMIYGIIPIILFSQIKNFKVFLKSYVILGCVVFFIYFLDPFMDYFFSFEYMIFGFQVMLPAFFALHIGHKVFNYKFMFLLKWIAFFEIFLWGNRMATISCVTFLIVMDLLYKKVNFKTIFKYLLLLIFLIIVLLNLEMIIKSIIEFFASQGIYSYSLRSVLDYLTGNSQSLSYGRTVIYGNAIEMIQLKPFFGYGTGYFEQYYGFYVHNFILDILLSYGIFGLLIFLILLANSLFQLIKSDKYLKLFGILLLCTSFPKLLTSIYIFIEPTFWLFILYGFFVPYLRSNVTENAEFNKEY